MGIYIRKMDMPLNCTRCACSDDGSRYCRAANEYLPMLGKPKFCPLVEIKEPHGDLIDRDDLKRAVKYNKEYFKDGECCSYFRNSANEPSTELWCVDEWVDGQPTIIERSEDDKI